MSELNDVVNHPSHYTDGKYETIDFIEDQGLGFHLGNAVKYISRCGKKDPDKEIEDLQKAKWYIHRSIGHGSNFATYPRCRIKPEDYCREKHLPEELSSAIRCLCDGSYTMAVHYIDLYINKKEAPDGSTD